MGNIASRFKWSFGTNTDGTAASGHLGSTGAGVAFNTYSWGENFTFYAFTDGAATCSYQIRTAPKSAGPWAVVSSGTLNTGATDIIQIPGPFQWLSPRIKTLNSTNNQVIVQMTAVEA